MFKIPCYEKKMCKQHLLIRFMLLCISSYLSCLKASAFTSGVSTECSKSAPSGPGKKERYYITKVQILKK